MRGEHAIDRKFLPQAQGSSPHARGTRFTESALVPDLRLIPACAGNTRSYFRLIASAAAHPRMRGEHQSPMNTQPTSAGSSPHARGTPSRLGEAATLGRLIPACAGNTDRGWASLRTPMAHPRMRGEHSCVCMAVPIAGGSSPHARGTQITMQTARRTPGLIPACAGNTIPAILNSLSKWAHPRMRGEHSLTCHGWDRAFGSSPHARGTPDCGRLALYAERLIPACAGNT